jgi:hypothetical protein
MKTCIYKTKRASIAEYIQILRDLRNETLFEFNRYDRSLEHTLDCKACDYAFDQPAQIVIQHLGNPLNYARIIAMIPITFDRPMYFSAECLIYYNKTSITKQRGINLPRATRYILLDSIIDNHPCDEYNDKVSPIPAIDWARTTPADRELVAQRIVSAIVRSKSSEIRRDLVIFPRIFSQCAIFNNDNHEQYTIFFANYSM